MTRERKTTAQKGSSIIEQALVYPILLGIILGAADVSRIFQAHSVLDEALRSTLRCVTPANGECINPATAQRENLYDIYQQENLPQYRVQQFSYRGEASWLQMPVHQISSLSASVIDSVEYPATAYNNRYQLERFRPLGTVGYAVQARSLPRVTLQNPVGLVPGIAYDSGGDQPTLRIGTPNINVRYEQNPPAGRRNILSDSVTFTLSGGSLFPRGLGDLRSGEKCFVQEVGGVNFSKECNISSYFTDARSEQVINKFQKDLLVNTALPSEYNQYTFLVIDIRGTVRSNNGATGAVELDISQTIDGNLVSRPLGGRRLAGSGASNFVPRGAPKDYYSSQFEPDYKEELNKHQAIMVKLGVPITLSFRLKTDRPDASLLGWEAEEISIYAPHYRTVTEQVACDSLVTRGDFVSNKAAACLGSKHAAGAPRTDTLTLPANAEEVLVQTICSADQEINAVQQLRERGVAQAEQYQRVSTGSGETCGTVNRQQRCPDNKGVAGIRVSSGGEERYCGSASLASVCPVPVEYASSACWKVVAKDLPLNTPVYWTQKNCSQSSPELTDYPLEAREYKELSARSELNPGLTQPLYTGSLSPEKFKEKNPSYQCDAFEKKIQIIGDNLEELKPESLFRSVVSLGANYKERLFSDAQNNFILQQKNLNPATYFEATESLKTVITGQPPTDPEQPYWIDQSEQRWTLLAHRVPEGQAPALCKSEPQRCRKEIVASNRSGPTEANFSANKAQEWGFAAVDAAMPGLEHSCASTSKKCIDLNLEEDFDQQGKNFVVRGEIRVPLILSSRPYTMSRIARGRWERDLIDE